jgi:hypothetical protein
VNFSRGLLSDLNLEPFDFVQAMMPARLSNSRLGAFFNQVLDLKMHPLDLEKKRQYSLTYVLVESRIDHTDFHCLTRYN